MKINTEFIPREIASASKEVNSGRFVWLRKRLENTLKTNDLSSVTAAHFQEIVSQHPKLLKQFLNAAFEDAQWLGPHKALCNKWVVRLAAEFESDKQLEKIKKALENVNGFNIGIHRVYVDKTKAPVYIQKGLDWQGASFNITQLSKAASAAYRAYLTGEMDLSTLTPETLMELCEFSYQTVDDALLLPCLEALVERDVDIKDLIVGALPNNNVRAIALLLKHLPNFDSFSDDEIKDLHTCLQQTAQQAADLNKRALKRTESLQTELQSLENKQKKLQGRLEDVQKTLQNRELTELAKMRPIEVEKSLQETLTRLNLDIEGKKKELQLSFQTTPEAELPEDALKTFYRILRDTYLTDSPPLDGPVRANFKHLFEITAQLKCPAEVGEPHFSNISSFIDAAVTLQRPDMLIKAYKHMLDPAFLKEMEASAPPRIVNEVASILQSVTQIATSGMIGSLAAVTAFLGSTSTIHALFYDPDDPAWDPDPSSPLTDRAAWAVLGSLTLATTLLAAGYRQIAKGRGLVEMGNAAVGLLPMVSLLTQALLSHPSAGRLAGILSIATVAAFPLASKLAQTAIGKRITKNVLMDTTLEMPSPLADFELQVLTLTLTMSTQNVSADIRKKAMFALSTLLAIRELRRDPRNFQASYLMRNVQSQLQDPLPTLNSLNQDISSLSETEIDALEQYAVNEVFGVNTTTDPIYSELAKFIGDLVETEEKCVTRLERVLRKFYVPATPPPSSSNDA